MQGVKRPVLRYFGGKWKLAPWIIQHFPPHRIYVEAFGGGASVLLRKPRSYGEVYNDLDASVVNVFRVIQAQAEELERLLRATPFARDEFELSMTPAETPLERARRAIALSFMGFGSDSLTRGHRTGFRSNSNRSGTTPAHDWAHYPDHLKRFCDRMAGVVIENRDAIEVMESQDSRDTLLYVDPPYVHDTRTTSGGYQFEMSDDDHRRLIAFLQTVKGMVVLSGYDHPLYGPLRASGWLQLEYPSLVFGNRPRTEVLWLNPLASAGQMQLRLGVAP